MSKMFTIFGHKVWLHPKMVVYFFRSFGKFLVTRNKIADEYTIQLRRLVCRQCPLRKEMQCSVCVCFITLKTLFTFEQCPKGKW